MKYKFLLLMCIICVSLMNVSIVFADDAINEFESSGEEIDLEVDYTKEEYEEFYKEEPVGEGEEFKVYYYVTFIDKVNNTKKEVKVEENKTVDEIEVKKEQVRLKGNKVKIFNYWADKNGKKYNFNKKVTKNITLYAKYYISTIYEKNFAKYDVVFNSQGGSDVNTIKATSGIILEPKEPHKQGYSFKGWYTKSTGGEKWNFKKDSINNNITLYAHWEKNGEYNNMISPKTGYDVENQFLVLLGCFVMVLFSAVNFVKIKKWD